MKIIKKVSQDDVLNHWKSVEGFTTDDFRSDIRDPLPTDLDWALAVVEESDVDLLFVISSDDWRKEGLCIPNFKLATVVANYSRTSSPDGKYADIRVKEMLFASDLKALDTKLFLVAPSINGPFTLIEGNKRAIALSKLGKLVGLETFCGISPEIKGYHWARCSQE